MSSRRAPVLTAADPGDNCELFAIMKGKDSPGGRRRTSRQAERAAQILQRTLAAEGFSQTEPRRLVLEVFIDNGKPLTPAAAHAQVADGRINLASVYRTIELFCRLGILVEVDHVAEGSRFELSDAFRDHHHHLICQGCGETEDFAQCEMKQIEKLIKRRLGFEVTRHELRFIGLCRRCRG